MPIDVKAAAVVGEIVSGLVDLAGAVRGFAESIKGWVEAADPSSVAAFDYALRSLSATVGFALVPAMQGFTELLKDVAGELMTPFTDLRDVVGEVTAQVLSIVRPLVAAFGSVLRDVVDTVKSFMPVVSVASALFEGLSALIGVHVRLWSALYASVYQSIAGLLNLDGAADAVRDAMHKMTIGVILLTSGILRLVGLFDVNRRFLEGFAKEPEHGRPGALQNVQLGDVMSGYKARLIAAGQGTAGPSLQQQQTDYLRRIKEIAEEQLKLTDGEKGYLQQIKEWIENFFIAGRRLPEPVRRNPWPDRQEQGGGPPEG